MNSSFPPTVVLPQASALFSQFQSRVRKGEALSLDAFCAAHPVHAGELRALHSIHQGLVLSLETQALASPAEADATAEALLASYQGRKPLFAARYKLLGARLGAGGMGVILKALDQDVGREVAIKIIRDQDALLAGGRRAQVSKATLARFLNEARITGQLEHPAIVPVHEIGVDGEGRPFFAMKLVHGRHLGDVLREVGEPGSSWTRERVLDVLLRVCEALAYAHGKEIIHRDLKPSNVMVGDFGEVYVMDWGLAKRIGAPEPAREEGEEPDLDEELEGAARTKHGEVVGTAYYMSPEQASGDRARMGAASDVYAVGATLYELIAGRPPFHRDGESSTPSTIRERLSRWELDPLPNEGVPAELQAICRKAMAREALARYRDMRELARDLRAYLDGRVVQAYETGAWAETKKWVQRNKALACSLAGGVLVLVVGIVFSTLKTREAEAARAQTDNVNTQLSQTNTKLGETITELNAQTKLANEKTAEAQSKTREVQDRARKEKRDADVLWAIDELHTLVNSSESLWPAVPAKLADLDRWIDRAKTLVQGRAATFEDDSDAKPGLEDHRRHLAELRAKALPRSEAELQSDRELHPEWTKLVSLRADLDWYDRMFGTKPWQDEARAREEASSLLAGTDANALNAEAWKLAGSDRTGAGGEERALLLAQRALELAPAGGRAGIRDTLAWALFRNGRFDEALREATRAVEEAPVAAEQSLAATSATRAKLEPSKRALEEQVRLWTAKPGAGREPPSAAPGEPPTNSETSDPRPVNPTNPVAARAALARESEALARRIERTLRVSYEKSDDQGWDDRLSKLVTDLEVFSDAESGLFSKGASATYGWGILRRREEAATLRERTIEGPEARRRWDEAIASIRQSSKYGGLELKPQLGLLPIGEDPHSHLWEFAHLQSGQEPARGPDGKVLRNDAGQPVLTPETGIVLVLIPGGTFTMGSQSTDPTADNYDPNAPEDAPAHAETLAAYFISKYEMTQGQWERATRTSPSLYGHNNWNTSWNRDNRAWSNLQPVEHVSWTQSAAALNRIALVLPTEAQWECAARGGSHTRWWCGDDSEALADCGNVADAWARDHGGKQWPCETWNDGALVTVDVGRYRPNAFGLHDTIGNVWEWCRDWWGDYSQSASAIDCERQVPPSPSSRVYRGGAFHDDASITRSAARNCVEPDYKSYYLGLRPARGITP